MPTNRSADVDAFMDALDHPMAPLVQRIRLAILRSEPELAERIKWRAPSFALAGVDRVTFNLRPTDRLQLILHRGTKAVDGAPFAFEDASGLLRMLTSERGEVTLRGADDVEAKEAALLGLVHAWVRA